MADDFTTTKVRDGIADRLRLITQFRQVSAGFPDQITVPCAIVLDRQGEYHQALGDPGHSQVTLEVLVLTGTIGSAGIARSYRELDPFISPTGPQSVKAAIEGDYTPGVGALGGIVDSVVVERYRDKGRLTFGGPEYIGVRFDVTVHP